MSQQNSSIKTKDSTISRRDILLGIGTATAMAYSGTSLAEMSHEHDHSKHSTQQTDLLDAVNNCLDKGQKCISHCLASFREGDTELAECASKAHEMHAICDAFSFLVTSNSEYIKTYAQVCERVCKDCEVECLKHKKHKECKACAEACADVVDQIKLRLS